MQCEHSIASIHRIKKNVHRCVIASRIGPFTQRASERSSDAAMRLTEKLEHYIFQ